MWLAKMNETVCSLYNWCYSSHIISYNVGCHFPPSEAVSFQALPIRVNVPARRLTGENVPHVSADLEKRPLFVFVGRRRSLRRPSSCALYPAAVRCFG